MIHLEVVLPEKPVSPMEVAKPSLGEKWRIHEELMEKGFQRHSGTSLMTGRWISEHFVRKLDFLDVLLLAGYFIYCIVRFLLFISCNDDYTTYG